ncbi:tensin isoform X2 [Pectinophora gossypiella]|uniref:tensin isoform X2 n=1 Tax=Pectinophora gossypiella TaxID=13191 RepID=UPI00214E7C26|nr:tensin isoform X2 [Pectinophora gossypiella]
MPWCCPWSRERQRPLAVSPPLQLLVQKEGVAQAHAFRSKSFRKPRPCHWCHQPVTNQASYCRVCKYVCHTTCESKVSGAVELADPANAALLAQLHNSDRARFSDTSWQIHRTWARNGDPLPLSPPSARAPAPPVTTAAPQLRTDQNGIYDTITPRAVSAPATPATPLARDQSGLRSASYPGPAGGSRLDLCYVAERMLALHLPERDAHAEAQAAHMLSNKHGEHFMVFEVSSCDGSGDGRVARAVFGRARSLGWSGDLAPPLERLCAACKHIESWLAAHPKNVAILLAWGSRERLGVLVAAYMHYSAICGAPEHALDRYAMRRYLDDRVPVFHLPSNKRYIDTFAGLLAGQIRVNAAPLHLTHVSVAGTLASPATPTIAFLKIYENFVCVYTSGLYMVSGGGWTVGVGRLALRGDVVVRAYRRAAHAHPSSQSSVPRRLVFACQFHTCAVADHTLSFTKQQLDHAAHDPAFPNDGAVELVFARGEGAGGAPPAPTPAAPLRAAPDALARHDSLEHLRPLSTLTDEDPGENNGSAEGSGSGGEAGESGEAAHTFGPLDGSIYATVVRAGGGGPASPLSASMDSGISSAGRRAAPSPPDELDALLGDMLRTVSALPDAPTSQSSADRAPDIPYHARADSAPFTYGAPGLRPGMLRAPNRLASPELVRRALGGDRSYKPIEDDDDERAPTPDAVRTPLSPRTLRKLTHEDVTTTSTAATTPSPLRNGRWLNGDAEWVDRPPSSTRKALPENGTWRSNSSLGWQESTRLREPRRSESGTESSGLTWLQRQQQKLRERKEARERVARLPLEWDAPASRHVRRSASHRVDGYTSDTTAFADDDEDFSVPLHVNTRTTLRNDSISPQAPDRTSSRKFMYEKMTMREWSASSTPATTPVPGLLSLAEPSDTRIRERSESWSRESRAGTPAFPTHPRTPYPPTPTPSLSARPPRSPPVTRKEREGSPESEYRVYNGSCGSRRSSLGGSAEPHHVADDRVRFARDTSHYWYKPNISRDDAVAALQPLEEGAFIVRDSNSFPGAFGLAVRAGPAGGVRHFLVEPTAKGVRLRGCPDEPVFSSLSALVYQHTVTPLALPVPLRLPDRDPWTGGTANAAARALLATGAACHVLLLGSENTEALTGPAAVKRAVHIVLQKKAPACVVHFKVFGGGITLTDSTRKLFFRRHYPANGVSYAGLDPDERRYTYVDNGTQTEKRVFAFVARASLGADNQCHVFAELEPEQPATAIVNFVNKALLGNSQKRDII